MKKYKLIAFDLDHTLFDFDKVEKRALEKVLKELGSYIDEERLNIYKKINVELWQMLENKQIQQQSIKLERFKRFFSILNLKADLQLASELYLKYLSQGSDLLDNSQEVVENLFQHYDLALVTNGLKQVQYSRYENSSLTPYFKVFIVSEEVGVAKPDPLIFHKMKENFPHIEKENIVMVGDNLGSDIKGGINYGIDTCWYNPNDKPANDDIKPTYVINDLRDLYNILGVKVR